MSRYPLVALITYIFAVIGGVVIVGGAVYALNIEGRNIGGIRFALFGAFAASAVFIWLIAGLAQALLNACAAVEREHEAAVQGRIDGQGQAVKPMQPEERYQPGNLNLDAFRRPDDRKNGA